MNSVRKIVALGNSLVEMRVRGVFIQFNDLLCIRRPLTHFVCLGVIWPSASGGGNSSLLISTLGSEAPLGIGR